MKATTTLTVEDDYRDLASLLNVELLKLNNFIDYGFSITKGVVLGLPDDIGIKKTISVHIHEDSATFDCAVLKIIVGFCEFYKLDCIIESENKIFLYNK